ncbi:type VI secretion system-associated protein TagF [Pseudoduganella namucuonensis]|uniref:Type VI secretion system protein ImpM n=1 Tax=Pseudoduganella namucuonensis TaxID=1035707 RepID=A0A1I7L4W4_9BURK|nr:type VI secretion system-associated protein TagF [Pseudoduganella namucuonensis]SFV04678.1 type VI secretion system protein ImpM [Pseudoduganella namucuonensis]
MEEPELAPGFFGKVTSHGDFVSRRLPQAMLAVWDGWLQASLQASRGALGPRWLDTYLTSPIWRFALAPGVCDNNAWAGVLMPSVDRVGRHFPLTLAAGAPGGGAVLDWVANCAPWFDRLEALALSSLEHGFALEQFDAALLATEPLSDLALPGQGGPAGSRVPLPSVDAVAAQAPLLAAAALRGQSIWWTDGSAQVEPSLLMCRGLPAPAAFAGLLAGNWAQTGWAGG